MKESKYNLFFRLPETKEVIAYNSRTNALAKLKEEDYANISGIVNGRIDNEKLRNDLRHGGYIIEDDFNEKEYLKYILNEGRYNTNSLGMTIAPTLGCNFRCVYCYESEQENIKKMNEQVQKKLVRILEGQVKTINNFFVTWYGGEPLMALDVIEKLSNKFLEICNKNEIYYSASIITNGYLLTPQVLSKLKEWEIESIQVTIDGTKQTHDERRFLSNGEGSFDRIIKNLKECSKELPNTVIRINVDKNNETEISDVLDILKREELLEYVSPYAARVDASNGQYENDRCLSVNDFSKLDIRFLEEVVNEKSGGTLMGRYPYLRGNACGADTKNSFIIDSNGDIYKCWDDIGRSEYCIGNVNEGIKAFKYIFKYALYDPTEDVKCGNCNILPICMGGCPRKRLDGKERCNSLKENLEQYFVEVAKELITGKSNFNSN